MGSCAFPFIYTWLLQCCTDKMHLTNCSFQETGVLEHVPFVASLLSLSAHMGGSLLKTQQHVAALFFFFLAVVFFFFFDIAKYIFLDIHGLFNGGLSKR